MSLLKRFCFTTRTQQLARNIMKLWLSRRETNGRWIFGIPSQSWKGKVECRITAWDNASASTQYNAIIEIIGDDPPKPFPWNWVLIIAFLGVALVVTELVFKPGLYRATGREKAKALEEEDRRREQEESEKET
jgi:hypothetical protein